MLIDTHAHLNFPHLSEEPVENVLARAKQNGVEKIINVGSDLNSSMVSVKLAQEYAEIFAAVGIHPHDAGAATTDQITKLEELLQNKKVVALGEIGLDYFKNLSPITAQQNIFQQQIELAIKYHKPIIIHNREADLDIFNVLKNYPGHKIVIHCFSGDLDYAHKLLDLGCYLSFTGNITFPKNLTGQSVVKNIPLERLMLETDCPFLTPVPHRGKTNEPAFVKLVAEKVAQLKNVTLEEVATVTTNTAQAFFGI